MPLPEHTSFPTQNSAQNSGALTAGQPPPCKGATPLESGCRGALPVTVKPTVPSWAVKPQKENAPFCELQLCHSTQWDTTRTQHSPRRPRPGPWPASPRLRGLSTPSHQGTGNEGRPWGPHQRILTGHAFPGEPSSASKINRSFSSPWTPTAQLCPGPLRVRGQPLWQAGPWPRGQHCLFCRKQRSSLCLNSQRANGRSRHT